MQLVREPRRLRRVPQYQRLGYPNHGTFVDSTTCLLEGATAKSSLGWMYAVMLKRRQHHNKAFLQAVGLAIRFFRLELSLSQEELGERCNVHRTYITEIEGGQRNISLLTLANVACALEIRAWRLLHFEQEQEQETDGQGKVMED